MHCQNRKKENAAKHRCLECYLTTDLADQAPKLFLALKKQTLSLLTPQAMYF